MGTDIIRLTSKHAVEFQALHAILVHRLHRCIAIFFSQSFHLLGNNFPTSLKSGFFLLVWSRQGIISILFS